MQRAKSLNLTFATSIWPASMPALLWGEWILAGRSDVTFDVSMSSLGEALRLAYPQLGLASLAEVLAQISGHDACACSAYGIKWNDRLSQVFQLILNTPPDFQKWLEEKKFSPRELLPLLAVGNLEEIEPLLIHLSKTHLSKTLAAQALEWSIELYLMGLPLERILAKSDNWWAFLQRLRRPMETQQIEKREQFLREVPFPARTSGQWLKDSDQPVLEIKTQARSPQELLQQLDKLKTVYEAWSKMESHS